MNLKTVATLVLALAAPLAVAQSSTWKADPAHSEVDFVVRHGGVSNVHGRFGQVDATLLYNGADPTKSSVKASIPTATINTGENGRDTHVRGGDFFDVAKYPNATFESTSVERAAGGLKVTGNLTLHGVTKPIVFNVEGPETPVENPMDHKLHSGFTATTTISRTAFGIGTAFPSALISDEVKLTLELEVVKQ